MNDAQGPTAENSTASRHLHTLTVLGFLSTCLYGVLAFLSWRFDYDSDTTERPILAVLVLFFAAFLAYLLAIHAAGRATQDRRLLGVIIWVAVTIRIVMLFSVPIQEIDIYRYLWDGAVASAGVSPFRYSPQQVRSAERNSTTDQELQRLVALRDSQPALAEILHRVHFGELPTIYPPTSQAVFAAASATTPSDAAVIVRVIIMKAWLVGFDLATLGVVIGLLVLCQQPIGLSVIYAWCPLLLKEVANSGHLDAVVVFLTTLAVYLGAQVIACDRTSTSQSAERSTDRRPGYRATTRTTLVAVVLGLAVGAKLYPIVLAPLMFLAMSTKIGWRSLLVPTAVFATTTFLVLWPMMPRSTVASAAPQDVAVGDASLLADSRHPGTPTIDPSKGVTTFLRRWEMNDFIFLLLVENLKPTAGAPADRVAWFSMVPESARQYVVERLARWCHVQPREVPFLATRAITASAFIAIALWLAHSAARAATVPRFLEAGFLTLAWFWLLCPTQNPWYWTWALPLLCFARGRAWLAVSGLVLLYYLRFWLSYHWPTTPVLGTGYIGTAFFDFVVTWLEYAPWLVCLALAYAVRRYQFFDRTSSRPRGPTRGAS